MLPIKKGTAPKQLLDAVRRIEATPDATLSWRNTTAEERVETRRVGGAGFLPCAGAM